MEHVNDPQEGLSTERAFEAEPIPSLSETITPRSLAVSFILGATLSVVAMKISLNSGFLPSLSIPAGLLAFYLSRAGIRVLDCFKVSHLPFTRQENTVIHTCVVACSSVTYSGGFGTFILAMGKKAAGADNRDVKNIVEPSIGRLIAFLFLVSFAGLFILMPLRKFMIIRHRLTFPSGTATAHLINSFHTPQGAKQARQQVKMLFSSFGGTVMWSIFQWFFTAGRGCGFKTFPMFGLQAVKHGFYFDFSMSNIGIGMICPYMITVSMFVGTILSSGFVWLYLSTKEGVWFPARMSFNSLSGIRGYKVFIGISMILADGLFNLLSIMVCTLCTMYKRRKQLVHGGGGGGNAQLPFQCLDAAEQQQPVKSFDDRRRAQVFLRDQIPDSVTIGCYVLVSVVSTVGIPYLYSQLKCHHVALIYLAAPAFAFCDAYGFGVTDMNLSTTYGKLAMLVFGSWVGLNDGGVIAALVACGIVMGIMCNSNDLMQDLKTGYLTLTSPRIVFLSQVIGTALGCVISPVVFWVFYNVYRTSGVGMDVYIPYPKVYRGIAMLGVGENGLPRHIMHLCKFFFALALALSAFRELAERRRWRVTPYVPSTVGIAVAFFVPPRLLIDMFIGGLGLYLWEHIEATQARTFSSAVASGLICGDGLGSLLSSLMTLTAARAPICIKFLSRPDNVRLDAFLGTLPMS